MGQARGSWQLCHAAQHNIQASTCRVVQAISFGLTQYDVEELMEYSGHACACQTA